jgi:excisionase family DNA binding protein
MVEYITIQEAAEKWGITSRRIQVLCAQGRLEGAVKFGRQWAIPANLKKPEDARIKNGKYMKEGNQNEKNNLKISLMN